MTNDVMVMIALYMFIGLAIGTAVGRLVCEIVSLSGIGFDRNASLTLGGACGAVIGLLVYFS